MSERLLRTTSRCAKKSVIVPGDRSWSTSLRIDPRSLTTDTLRRGRLPPTAYSACSTCPSASPESGSGSPGKDIAELFAASSGVNGLVLPDSSGKNIIATRVAVLFTESPVSVRVSTATRDRFAESTSCWLTPSRGVRQVGHARKLCEIIFPLHSEHIR